MTADQARDYLDNIGAGRFVQIVKLLSLPIKIVDASGEPASKFYGIVSENMHTLETYFAGRPITDEQAANLASFLKGLLGEKNETTQ